MRIPRFIVPEKPTTSDIRLSGEESHHLKKVLRLDPGAALEIYFEDCSESFAARLLQFDGSEAVCAIEERIERPPLPRAVLCAALIAKDKCDFIVEKAVEVGAAEVHFFSAARSQEKLKIADAPVRIERWNRIARAALKQSGAPALPKIEIHSDLAALLGSLHPVSGDQAKLLLQAPPHPAEGISNMAGQPVRTTDLIAQLEACQLSLQHPHQASLEKVRRSVDSYILIGPEGGFTGDEVNAALAKGYAPVSLGANVLRAETAATVALGAVQLFWFSTAAGKC